LEEAGCVRGRFVELVHVKSTATPVNSQLLELGHQVRDRDANWTNSKQLELKKKTKTNQTDTLRKKGRQSYEDRKSSDPRSGVMGEWLWNLCLANLKMTIVL